jgi:hypothetical protein
MEEDASLDFLECFSRLNSLKLNFRVDDIVFVSSRANLFPGIRVLYVPVGSESLQFLAHFPALDELRLFCDFHPVSLQTSTLNKAAKLTKLSLRNCDVTDIAFLNAMQNLECLHLSESAYMEDFRPLANLRKLKYLNIP